MVYFRIFQSTSDFPRLPLDQSYFQPASLDFSYLQPDFYWTSLYFNHTYILVWISSTFTIILCTSQIFSVLLSFLWTSLDFSRLPFSTRLLSDFLDFHLYSISFVGVADPSMVFHFTLSLWLFVSKGEIVGDGERKFGMSVSGHTVASIGSHCLAHCWKCTLNYLIPIWAWGWALWLSYAFR